MYVPNEIHQCCSHTEHSPSGNLFNAILENIIASHDCTVTAMKQKKQNRALNQILFWGTLMY